MVKASVGSLNKTLQKANEWVEELAGIGDFRSPQQAYTALHAVLHVLRDALDVDEAAQLAAGMPMLIRGLYYEGWKPAAVPRKVRGAEQFLERVEDRFGTSPIDPEHACRAVFELLERRIAAGEIEDVRHALHHGVRSLWGEPAVAAGPQSRTRPRRPVGRRFDP